MIISTIPLLYKFNSFWQIVHFGSVIQHLGLNIQQTRPFCIEIYTLHSNVFFKGPITNFIQQQQLSD